MLTKTGGLTIDLVAGRIATVKRVADDHPWVDPPRPKVALPSFRSSPS